MTAVIRYKDRVWVDVGDLSVDLYKGADNLDARGGPNDNHLARAYRHLASKISQMGDDPSPETISKAVQELKDWTTIDGVPS